MQSMNNIFIIEKGVQNVDTPNRTDRDYTFAVAEEAMKEKSVRVRNFQNGNKGKKKGKNGNSVLQSTDGLKPIMQRQRQQYDSMNSFRHIKRASDYIDEES